MRLRNEIRANQFLNVFGVGTMMDVDQQSIMVCSPKTWRKSGGIYPLGDGYKKLPDVKAASSFQRQSLHDSSFRQVRRYYRFRSSQL